MDCELLNKTGLARCAEKKYLEGAKYFKQALATNPKFLEARYNLGITYHRLQLYPEAIVEYQLLLPYMPHNHALHNKLANALQLLEKHKEAIYHFQQAVLYSPQPEYFFNLANAFKQTGDYQAAEKNYIQAIRLKPGYVKALNNLGSIYFEKGYYDRALKVFEDIINIQPHSLMALTYLGEIFALRNDYQKAANYFRLAIDLDPENVALIDSYIFMLKSDCHLHGFSDWIMRLRELSQRKINDLKDRNILPFHSLSLDITAKERLDIAKHYADRILAECPLVKRTFLRKTIQKRLRVAYFSGNFYDHPSIHLISGVLEQHDKNNIELFAYSHGANDKSQYRERVEKAVERFINIENLTIDKAVQQILDDKIDVAIDLTSYTNFGKPKIFAKRIAPIQIGYLGFPGTSGSPWLDYYIADATVLPVDKAQFFSEKIITLPITYFPTDNRLAIAEEGPSREACGLPENSFVYCCFCTNYKIDVVMFNAWMEILKRVPNSVLWFYTDRKEVIHNLRDEAMKQGVSGERLIFASREKKEKHLFRHRHADLFLDTRVYNAHTTAADSLWAGLPILTLLGDEFSARVSASIIKAAGLEELITYSLEEYIHEAVSYATEKGKLKKLKTKIQKKRNVMPLFDTKKHAHYLECAYQHAWQNYLKGLPAASFCVSSN